MGALSALLLIIFLAAFFWLDQFTQILVGLNIASVADNHIVLGTVSGFQIAVSQPGLRAFLGIGAVFFEFLIIIVSMFDRVLDTIKVIVKPLTVVVPLVAFVYSAYQTFEPVVRTLLPTEISGASTTDLVTIVSTPQFNQQVLITFAFMVLYLIFSRLFVTDNAEIRSLRAENQKLKRKL